MRFSPQRRAIFRHRNFKKCFWTLSLLTTSEFQKVLRDRQFLCVFTSKCAFRHSGVQFFDIHFKKCSEHEVTCTFWLHNALLATAARNFCFLLWPHDSAPAALTGLWPDTRIIQKTQHFATSLTFGADVSSFFWLSRFCIFFLLTWLLYSAFQLSILSEVCYLNFLRWKKAQHRLYNAWDQKDKDFHWKNISKLKNLINSHQKKRSSTVLRNVWNQNNKHFYWKSIFKRSETKKTNTFTEKTIPVLKTLQFHVKKTHSTVFHNAWNQKKLFHWKINFQKVWDQKNKHFHWKNNSGLKNFINSNQKQCTAPSSTMPYQKTNTFVEKSKFKRHSVLQRSIFRWKKAQHHLPQCLKPKQQTLSLKKSIFNRIETQKQTFSLKKQFMS